MKKGFSTLLMVLLIAASAFAQSSIKDLFDGKTKLYFYGIDFTQARFIGTNGFKDPPSLLNYFIPEWNGLFIKEAPKYTLQKALHLNPDSYITSVSHHTNLNKKIDVASKISDNPHSITEEDLKNAIKQYDVNDKDGIGLTYIVESLSKAEEKATVWVTFFDVSTKAVLLTEKIQGDANGGTFRNYWAGAILKINNSIANKYYKNWKSQFKKDKK